jgi:RNA polymerase-binding transcription factor DksA
MASVSDVSNESIDGIGRTLDAVDVILERLRAGTYQQCDHCGEPIGYDRLTEEPLVTSCTSHPKLTAE